MLINKPWAKQVILGDGRKTGCADCGRMRILVQQLNTFPAYLWHASAKFDKVKFACS